MSTPLVHVLVINWNGLEHLEACFASLLAGTYANCRFVLVDNASEDTSVAFVRENFGHDSRVEFLQCPTNLGWSGGNNVAMERALEAGADYVFLLNNDTAVAPDAMEKLVEMAEEGPELGAIAPKMVLFDHPEILNSVGLECSLIGASWDKGVGRQDAPRWNRSEAVIGVCGGACLLRSEALHKTGLLPAHFGIYLDDLDLCLRIWNAGYEIWSCPEAVVRHKFSATLGQGRSVRKKYYLNTRNRLYLVFQGFPISKMALVKVAMLVGETRALGRAALEGEFWRIGAHMKAWGAAALYVPQALGERWRRRRQGLGTCRFWHLVRRDRMFCPGVELPEQGWYTEREVAGLRLRPMGKKAWIETGGGRLRVKHANCYPALGATEVRVSAAGDEGMVLSTLGEEECEIQISAGRINFEARHLFDAEDTGELCDLGGWLRLDVLQTETEPGE